MTDRLDERLDKILPKVTSDEFLTGAGIGNEIAFYIFDYPPEQELRVREHIQFLLEHIPRRRPELQIEHVNLLGLVTEHLCRRNLLEKAFKTAVERGEDRLRQQLSKILSPEKLKSVFVEQVQPEQKDLVFVSGVGSVYPMMRAHTLLNNLHSVMGQTPLIMFYPGQYDGQYLRLFGKLKNDNYYRAFRLVP